jgi:hypothetical protein
MGSTFTGRGFLGDLANHMMNTVGMGRSTPGWGNQLGPNGGAYAGVPASLAGANAGYGGTVQPGASPMAHATPVNPYAIAAGGKSGYQGT